MPVPFVPHPLPPAGLDYERLLPLVGEAGILLGRYDGLLGRLPRPDLILSLLATQEAVLSSRIEGTQATFGEVLRYEAGAADEGSNEAEIREIINYRTALQLAEAALHEQPITLSLVRQTHRVLMNGVRGQDKMPGEFRRVQNWIGPARSRLEQASYVPPDPATLHDHLDAWIGYLGRDDVDPLLQTGVMHGQFEIIHPFLDGNGRIGRLLIPLLLFQRGVLSRPVFYLSQVLEQNRDEYYRRLLAISNEGDWSGWLVFFLGSVIEQARRNCTTLNAILALYGETAERVRVATRSQHTLTIVELLFTNPFFTSSRVEKQAAITKPAANALIDKLQSAGLVRQLVASRGRQPAIYGFQPLLNLLSEI